MGTESLFNLCMIFYSSKKKKLYDFLNFTFNKPRFYFFNLNKIINLNTFYYFIFEKKVSKTLLNKFKYQLPKDLDHEVAFSQA